LVRGLQEDIFPDIAIFPEYMSLWNNSVVSISSKYFLFV